MQPEVLKLFIDILQATEDIQEFTKGMNLSSYRMDHKCRAAVERKFEIIGEACTRLRNHHPDIFDTLENGHRVIGLRNRLIHGYDSVDDAILWDVVTSQLLEFVKQIKTAIQ